MGTNLRTTQDGREGRTGALEPRIWVPVPAMPEVCTGVLYNYLVSLGLNLLICQIVPETALSRGCGEDKI